MGITRNEANVSLASSIQRIQTRHMFILQVANDGYLTPRFYQPLVNRAFIVLTDMIRVNELIALLNDSDAGCKRAI